MDWSIQEIARIAGTTSRTLRHYDDIGLLKPSRTGHNGYRYYDGPALVQLQRILLLRELGLGLPAIAEVLHRETDTVKALSSHLEWLGQERDRLARQIASVRQTIDTMQGDGKYMAQDMFDGFDHTQYKDEVEERWGKDAYAAGDSWWRGMSAEEKQQWKDRVRKLGSDWSTWQSSGPTAPKTPGSSSARAKSSLFTRARAWGERSTAASAIPGSFRSAV